MVTPKAIRIYGGWLAGYTLCWAISIIPLVYYDDRYPSGFGVWQHRTEVHPVGLLLYLVGAHALRFPIGTLLSVSVDPNNKLAVWSFVPNALLAAGIHLHFARRRERRSASIS